MPKFTEINTAERLASSFEDQHAGRAKRRSVNFRACPFIPPFTLGSIIEPPGVDNRYGSIIGSLRYVRLKSICMSSGLLQYYQPTYLYIVYIWGDFT